ncbi:MAG: DNA primase [Methylophilaceae bacterium]
MIPESFIQELLNRVDVVDVIDKRIQLKKAGANYVTCCPFHQEKTPSFSVSPSKQFYHCFGCGAHGSSISFLIEHDGLTFIDAVNELASGVGLKVPNDSYKKSEYRQENLELEDALKIANHYFKSQLRESSKAINYLKSRGLTGQIAKEFSIGYAPEGWQNLRLAFKDYESNTLIKSGLTIKNDQGRHYDRFRDRIMFPIYSTKGHVIGFGGRVINPEDNPKYYNSPETPLFQKSYELYGLSLARKAIREKGYVIVVEGYMDVIGLAQHNIRNVVATLGTATTEFHIKKLIRYAPEIIFCFDGDKAGQAAAWRAMNNALSALTDNIQLKFLFLPNQHDPDSYVSENSSKEFESLLKQAIPLTEYIVKYLTIENDLVGQEKKVKFLNEIEPIFKKITAIKLSFLFKKRMAQLVGLDIDEINQIISTIKNPYKKSKIKIHSRIPISPTRRFCLFLLLKPKLARVEDLDFFSSDHLDDRLAREIIEVTSFDKNYNTVAIIHYLSSRFDGELIDQLHVQLTIFDEGIKIEEEIDALRSNIQRRHFSVSNKSKLNVIKQKSMNALTAEEREFLKNITKR